MDRSRGLSDDEGFESDLEDDQAVQSPALLSVDSLPKSAFCERGVSFHEPHPHQTYRSFGGDWSPRTSKADEILSYVKKIHSEWVTDKTICEQELERSQSELKIMTKKCDELQRLVDDKEDYRKENENLKKELEDVKVECRLK
eukprot:UN23709